MNSLMFRQLAIVFVLALVVPSISSGPANAQQGAGFVAGEILVKFKPGTPGDVIAAAHRRNRALVQEVIAGIDVQIVRVPIGQEARLVTAYLANPHVLFAEVNGFYREDVHGTTDPRVSEQWQYNNQGQTGGTSDADIDAFEAWHATTGNGTVAIAILDGGIDQSHEDLSSKIARNANFTLSDTVDDKRGHGTHVAGSAAAATDNGVGVAGTCPNCALYNVKVIDDTGVASTSAAANGIVWAADNGAKVINMSLGGPIGSSTLQEAVTYAWNKGVVLVAGAGNDGVSDVRYPAAYEQVIAVAATDHNDGKPGWSNFGTWVDVAAPGARILSTLPDHLSLYGIVGDKYGSLDGTSMAAPHVAGLAGLIWSTGLCSTNTCVRSRIETRADAISGTGTYWTYGRINASNSVSP